MNEIEKLAFEVGFRAGLQKEALSTKTVMEAYGKRMGQAWKAGGGKAGLGGWLPRPSAIGGMKGQAEFLKTPQGERYMARVMREAGGDTRKFIGSQMHMSKALMREQMKKAEVEKDATFGQAAAEGTVKTIGGVAKKLVGGKWVDHTPAAGGLAEKAKGLMGKLMGGGAEKPTPVLVKKVIAPKPRPA